MKIGSLYIRSGLPSSESIVFPRDTKSISVSHYMCRGKGSSASLLIGGQEILTLTPDRFFHICESKKIAMTPGSKKVELVDEQGQKIEGVFYAEISVFST